MAAASTPHYLNEAGVPVIEIGAREFMCVGALPPFDHPHIFVDMGVGDEAVCGYCATLYRYRATLGPHDTVPAGQTFDAHTR